MKQAMFRIEEIHCESCEQAIRRSLGRLGGVEAVEPDQATNEVRVAYDEARVRPEDLVARLADAGFPLAPEGREET